MQEDSTAEVARKVARVAEAARERHLGAIVIAAQPDFAWLTAGRSNRIDITREGGSAMLAIAADGRRFALASEIEAPRVRDETLAGLGFEIVDYPWAEERADPSLPFRIARRLVGSDEIGADVATPHAHPVEGWIAKLRATLDDDEIPRYRALAAECGHILGTILRHAPPGSSEEHVKRRLASALIAQGITPVVLLAGADARVARYRHPVATDLCWRDRLLAVVCAERGGQVVALSRMLSNGADQDLAARTRAVAGVFAALLERTRAGTTGAELYRAAAAAYAAAGHAGEERCHHQGGAIGYRSREWVAHPGCLERVTPPQAFAWNPSVAGAKVEDTCIVHGAGRIELVTSTPGWPTIEITVRDERIAVADVLVLDA